MWWLKSTICANTILLIVCLFLPAASVPFPLPGSGSLQPVRIVYKDVDVWKTLIQTDWDRDAYQHRRAEPGPIPLFGWYLLLAPQVTLLGAYLVATDRLAISASAKARLQFGLFLFILVPTSPVPDPKPSAIVWWWFSLSFAGPFNKAETILGIGFIGYVVLVCAAALLNLVLSFRYAYGRNNESLEAH